MYLGYVRVSTGKQTVENQMFAIEDFCAHQNPPIHIDDWIIETASGMKHFDKRKLGKKLQSVTSDDTIISTEITRLGRSLLMIFSIMAYCLGKGCGIWTIKEGWRLGQGCIRVCQRLGRCFARYAYLSNRHQCAPNAYNAQRTGCDSGYHISIQNQNTSFFPDSREISITSIMDDFCRNCKTDRSKLFKNL